ncbi:hypothetical protein [Aeoliella sp.]|uniref:DUF7919 family protein n=1 Tax=Aeoliella sp. TaxID=2795800 RepID=UPI003CCBB8C5
MSHLSDLSTCTYLPRTAEHILSVGWLARDVPYLTGPTPSEIYSRLVEFAKDPWQPFACCGIHECGICQFQSEARGVKNLFFPFEEKIYVCPELITHYMNAHHYRPPQVFCDAVMACPPMRSMEYKQLLLACNGSVLWK